MELPRLHEGNCKSGREAVAASLEAQFKPLASSYHYPTVSRLRQQLAVADLGVLRNLTGRKLERMISYNFLRDLRLRVDHPNNVFQLDHE